MKAYNLFLFFVIGLAFISGPPTCDAKDADSGAKAPHSGSGAKVMMEYIGATGKPVQFTSVPIRKEIDFHYILGFAIDADSSGKPQNGKFSPFWSSTLTPASVLAIKKAHSNVKVSVSLGGWSINEKPLVWYDPKNTSEWISNAFESLKALIKKYNLDGIDIDYENFPKKSLNSSFPNCIGELVNQLKKNKIITVATIAPFYLTADAYIELYRKYKGDIDYVNYQFYTDNIHDQYSYLKVFKERAKQFDEAKLLPSYEVKGRGIQGDKFFDTLQLLKKKLSRVNGVMIYAADASEDSEYYYEVTSQKFLLNEALK